MAKYKIGDVFILECGSVHHVGVLVCGITVQMINPLGFLPGDTPKPLSGDSVFVQLPPGAEPIPTDEVFLRTMFDVLFSDCDWYYRKDAEGILLFEKYPIDIYGDTRSLLYAVLAAVNNIRALVRYLSEKGQEKH